MYNKEKIVSSLSLLLGESWEIPMGKESNFSISCVNLSWPNKQISPCIKTFLEYAQWVGHTAAKRLLDDRPSEGII